VKTRSKKFHPKPLTGVWKTFLTRLHVWRKIACCFPKMRFCFKSR
jgi:hypothetical protein